ISITAAKPMAPVCRVATSPFRHQCPNPERWGWLAPVFSDWQEYFAGSSCKIGKAKPEERRSKTASAFLRYCPKEAGNSREAGFLIPVAKQSVIVLSLSPPIPCARLG